MKKIRPALLAWCLLILVVAACQAAGCRRGAKDVPAEAADNPPETADQPLPVRPLPQEMLGTWTYHKPWVPEFSTPAFWGKAEFSEKTFFVSEGERSKDSGSWFMQGTYAVKSGKGTPDDPWVLTLSVDEGGGSGSVGYPKEMGPGHKGDLIEARVHTDGDTLHFQAPKTSMELEKKNPEKESESP